MLNEPEGTDLGRKRDPETRIAWWWWLIALIAVIVFLYIAFCPKGSGRVEPPGAQQPVPPNALPPGAPPPPPKR